MFIHAADLAAPVEKILCIEFLNAVKIRLQAGIPLFLLQLSAIGVEYWRHYWRLGDTFDVLGDILLVIKNPSTKRPTADISGFNGKSLETRRKTMMYFTPNGLI